MESIINKKQSYLSRAMGNVSIAEHNSKTGWSQEEDKLLFEQVKNARNTNLPLRLVFEQVARATGRQPNSVRNYYYLRIRDKDIVDNYADYIIKTTAFVPFEQEEVRELVRFILAKQALNISVRAATLELANGDTTAMLRYQNKYRSILKTNPQLICEVADELEEEGLPHFNPYDQVPQRNKVGRPRKLDCRDSEEDMLAFYSETIHELEEVEGLDVKSLFECLGKLAISAINGADAIKRLGMPETTLN